jgi:energy-coupling factor transporter ATP-binding protein EcfA2
MLMEPRVLLLDEPTSGTTQADREQFRTMITGIRDRGTGVALIDHDVKFVSDISDTILAMNYWARADGAFIAEDDYDGEFRYDVAPLPALYGLDPEMVIYLGTTTKTFTPAVRVGWLAASPELITRLAMTPTGSMPDPPARRSRPC